MSIDQNRKTYRVIEGDPPSKEFINSLGAGVGSPRLACGFCGREHYCPDSPGISDEEKTSATYLHEVDPDGVILHHNVDSVSANILNGIEFVVECPCNGLRLYEDFMWNERETIIKYIKAKSQRLAEESTKNLAVAASIDL